ncbi:MAG TPA: phosphate acetyltransferase [Armatimonadota bacterium]|jgi:phosphate acetyltransferase|nr:phosphate acetyltransferase [Armatimonadota bacterium]
MGLESIIATAQAAKKRIVFPEGDEPRTLKAARELVDRGIVQPILLGSETAVKAAASAAQVNLEGVTVVDPATQPRRQEYADILFEKRQKKGMTAEQAYDLSADPMYCGVLMVSAGDADGEVSGAVHSTADTLRPALQVLGAIPEYGIVSSVMIMDLPSDEYGDKGTLLFADCGLCVNPTAEELACIAMGTARTGLCLLGMDARVAMLCFSTKGSGKGDVVDKVVQATAIVKERWPDIQVDGELQVDAALVPWIGQKKAPGSTVAGHANTLIFPDLQSGNIGYKLVERLAGAQAVGPILQGLRKPVNDLSRGCSFTDIVNVAAITAVQSLPTSTS